MSKQNQNHSMNQNLTLMLLGRFSCLDGKNINLEMLHQGLAEVYRERHPHGFDISVYRQAEVDTWETKRGLWLQIECIP